MRQNPDRPPQSHTKRSATTETEEKPSIFQTLLHLPLLLLKTINTLLTSLLHLFLPPEQTPPQTNTSELYRNTSSPLPEVFILSSPGLTTLLDVALYHAHEAELVPTTCAASRLLGLWLEMKECSALLVRECRTMVGTPFSGMEMEGDVVVGCGGVLIDGDDVLDTDANCGRGEGVSEEAKWNEYEIIHDFAMQCFLASKEAICRLSTDKLADSANLTLHDSISWEEGKKDDIEQTLSDESMAGSTRGMGQQSSGPTAEMARCYKAQPRSTCWESTRLYCPDYSWADDCISLCQRLIRNLNKHKLLSMGNTSWNRYAHSEQGRESNIMSPPTYASSEPHPFPSLEALHALKYLTSELLPSALPCLNQFRAAVESNAVVSKRLYLVKCEYRAPIRAHMESWMALKAAPKLELVERYLKEFHGVSNAEGEGGQSSNNQPMNRNIRRKGSSSAAEPLALHRRRDVLEKTIAEQWKHPNFLEALQLERLCERLEMEMSQILLPLSTVASEIMEVSKGRIRAVAVLTNETEDGDSSDDDDESVELSFEEVLGWRDVPYMRELLKCLKSILCRKPGPDESSGIRPLLLDLQGVPRKNDDLIDLSMEVSFYKPLPKEKPSFFGFLSRDSTPTDKWYYLEQFISRVETLLKLISQPGMPFLIGDHQATRWQELIENCMDVWDSDLFRAQFQDWYDMVTRQRELNTTTDGSSLSQISEVIREAEIELSIAMASRSQLELVRQRLEALIVDKNARYMVLAQIVNDVALRELNENIVLLPMSNEMSSDFPKLSAKGVFGDQLLMSEEVLPIG